MVGPALERLVPHLVVRDAGAAIAWYESTLDFELVAFVPHPEDGRVLHAELRGHGGALQIADDHSQFGTRLAAVGAPRPIMLVIESPRARELHARSLAAGAQQLSAFGPAAHGAEFGQVLDPHGCEWTFIRRLHEVTSDDMELRVDELVARRGD
ncbi:MAG: hypothetical protein RIR65_1951 [Planctomycetota bacterium]|jgi:uncharacterized glyoxalase superfamily protein PhnB